MYKEKATLVFDIETVPDIAKAKQLYQLDNLTDAEAFEALKNMRVKKLAARIFFAIICTKSSVFPWCYAWAIASVFGL